MKVISTRLWILVASLLLSASPALAALPPIYSSIRALSAVASFDELYARMGAHGAIGAVTHYSDSGYEVTAGDCLAKIEVECSTLDLTGTCEFKLTMGEVMCLAGRPSFEQALRALPPFAESVRQIRFVLSHEAKLAELFGTGAWLSSISAKPGGFELWDTDRCVSLAQVSCKAPADPSAIEGPCELSVEFAALRCLR